MSKLSTAIAFLLGAAAGGTAVWYYTKDKYAKIAEEEINSVKEAYAQREQKRIQEAKAEPKEEEPEMTDPTPTPAVSANTKAQEKGNITDYAAKYTQVAHPPKEEKEEEPAPKADSLEKPYVIEPEEFGELDGYGQVSLTFFEDGVLADEYGVVVDDPEDIVGDALEHFGEYEDDSVYCRSDARKCDYEILKDLRTYEEFRKTLPRNI